MQPLYTISDIRHIERTASARLSTGTLMQRAGLAASHAALSLIRPPYQVESVLVLAGPGNNGGDALEAARHLDQAGCMVTVLLLADEASQPMDARTALQLARRGNVRFTTLEQFIPESTAWSLVIDGLFGIGLGRPLPADLHALIRHVNGLSCPVLALDVPSGLHADTGALIGDIAIRATHTITFIGDKPGLHTASGRDHAGVVHVDRLEIDSLLFPAARVRLNSPQIFQDALQPRRHDSHKGNYGNVTVVGGAAGMGGAAILAARAALHAGAGRVIAAFIDNAPPYDGMQPELMCVSAASASFQSTVVVAGPGLGQSRASQDALSRALASTANTAYGVVLDADALNLIAANPRMHQQLAGRSGHFVMTPHPLEAARLLGISTAAVQTDRVTTARRLAERFNAVIVLKGSGTVIAAPDTPAVINPTGNPALATGGTGDVLAGLCGALLAQDCSPIDAALAAVWVHGSAADALVERGVGPVGMTASEVAMEARHLLNKLVSAEARKPYQR